MHKMPPHIVDIKGTVSQYCYDAKSFNLTVCFITKCDTICYGYVLKMADHGQQCTTMYEI